MQPQDAPTLPLVSGLLNLPTELLLAIFVEYLGNDFRRPWILSSVCRRFQAILLEWPQLWASVELSPILLERGYPSPKTIDLWLERCRRADQQVSASFPPWSPTEVIDSLCRHSSSFKLLTFFDHNYLLTRVFPHLEELRLGSFEFSQRAKYHLTSGQMAEIRKRNFELRRKDGGWSCLLAQSRYPQLRRLHLHALDTATMVEIAMPHGFPPLEELCIHANVPYWLDLVRYCARSLTKLSVRFGEHCISPTVPSDASSVEIPSLRHLAYHFIGVSPPFWRLPSFVTPVLDVYEQDAWSARPQNILHNDLKNVNTIIWRGCISARGRVMPRVVNLELYSLSATIHSSCVYLASNEALYPNLKSVAVFKADDDPKRLMDSVVSSFQKRAERTGIPIQLTVSANPRR